VKAYLRFPNVEFGKGLLSVKVQRAMQAKESLASTFSDVRRIVYIAERSIVEVDNLGDLTSLADYLDVSLDSAVSNDTPGFGQLIATFSFGLGVKLVTESMIHGVAIERRIEISEVAPFRDPLVSYSGSQISFYVRIPDPEPSHSMVVYDVSGSVQTGQFHAEEFTRWQKPRRM